MNQTATMPATRTRSAKVDPRDRQTIMELAANYLFADMATKEAALENPDATAEYLRVKLSGRKHEHFGVLFLDTRHRPIAYKELFHGTIDGAKVYPRVVVKECLEMNAAAVIIAHNHPSGDPEPSLEDQSITRRLKDALSLLDIRLLDHFVIGSGKPCSMAARGMV